MAENPEVKLTDVRLSFADNLFEAERGEPRPKGKHQGKIPFRWSSNFLIPKSNTALVDKIRAAMREARDQKWPTDPPKIKGDKLCLQDGDEVSYAGYEGHFYLSASRTAYGSADGSAPKRPYRIIDRNKVKRDDGTVGFPDLAPDDGRPYSGCYVNVILRIWAQDDPDYGKRINASIEGVQYWRDGEAFGGGKKIDVNEAFDEFGGDDGFDDSPAEKPSSDADDLLS